MYNLVKIKICHSLFGQSITHRLLRNLLGLQTKNWCTLQIKPSSSLSERQSCNHPNGCLKNTMQFTHCIVHSLQIRKTGMICFLLLKSGTQLRLLRMTKRNHFLRLGLCNKICRQTQICYGMDKRVLVHGTQLYSAVLLGQFCPSHHILGQIKIKHAAPQNAQANLQTAGAE